MDQFYRWVLVSLADARKFARSLSPSTTNIHYFLDKNSKRLIYDGDNYDQARYLLGCDAVPCCVESQSGNHLEYQIPNIHPAFLAKVSDLGEHTIEQSLDGKCTKPEIPNLVFPLPFLYQEY